MTDSAEKIDRWTSDIHQGDAREVLSEMPADSVHLAMCSPPYFGLRDYGVDGQIGLEDSLDEYIRELVAVADEMRRVLRDDGSWWLNLGDSFAGSWGAQSKYDEANHRDRDAYPGKNPARNGTLRRKSKMLVPHRVAIALQDAGWIVRSDAVWSKPNPMPHPVKDRLHEHKEFIFHLTPEPDYWFDLDAIREPHKTASVERRGRSDSQRGGAETYGQQPHTGFDGEDLHAGGKNPGDILEVSVKAFPEAHFAVYPPELVETPIKSSCPPKVCASCGTPHERVVEDVPLWEHEPEDLDRDQAKIALEKFEQSDLTVEHLRACRATGVMDTGQGKETQNGENEDETARLAGEAKDALGGYVREFYGPKRRNGGFQQTCDCDTDDTKPGIALDPFAGAGTTALVAKELGRRFIGTELNPEYVAMAQKRIGVTVDEPERLLEDEETSITAFANGGEHGQ